MCERPWCLTTLFGCVNVYVCVCEERGRCLTTLVGCICVCVCVCEERGMCLTTLVGYVGGYGRQRKMFEVFDNLGWVCVGTCLYVRREEDLGVCLCLYVCVSVCV